MDNQTVTIELARYEELIKKEALLDRLTAGKELNVYLVDKSSSYRYTGGVHD